MKKMILMLVMMAVGIGRADEFFPNGFRVAETNLDWTADAIVVKGEFPATDPGAVSNFVEKGGAFVVLAGEKGAGVVPDGLGKHGGIGVVLSYPNDLGKDASGSKSYRCGKGFVLTVPEKVGGRALLENVKRHLSFLRLGYVMHGITCNFEKGYPTVWFKTNYVGPLEDEQKPHRDYQFEVVAESPDGKGSSYQQFPGRNPRRDLQWGIAVTENLFYPHGKTRVRGILTDKTTNTKIVVHDAVYERPEYLELALPPANLVTTDRQSAAVRIGVRINDEPHFSPDAVKVRVLAPNGNEHWKGEVSVKATETTVWTQIPFASKAEPVGGFRIEAETMRDGDRPVRAVRTLNVVKTPRSAIDQDGMAIVDGVRRMTFVSDEVQAKDFKEVATFSVGNRDATATDFARKIVTARKRDPGAALSCSVEVGTGTGDLEKDLGMLRMLAHLALVSGANAVVWKKNTAELVTDGLAREIAAFGPEALVPSPTIVSTDGFVFARLFGNTLVCVNTERFAAHESVIRSVRLPKGELKLTLAPDEVRVMTLQ